MLRKLKFKVLFFLFLLVFPFTLSSIEIQAEEHQAPDVSTQKTLKIAAWNIEEFGRIDDPTKGSKRSEDNLKDIAKILSQYDLIVITEFMDDEIKVSKEGKVEGLKEESEKSDFIETLNYLSDYGDYDHRVSPFAGYGRDWGKEWYAFLFKKEVASKKFEVLELPQLLPDPKEREIEFSRDPCWATFRVGDFDFTIIAVHIHFTKWEKRKAEVRELKNVYDTIQGMDPQENDILLVGDFNLDPDHDAFDPLKKIETMKELFYKKNGCKSTSAKVKPLYDNILFDTKYLDNEYANNCGIYLFDLDKPDDLKCCEGKKVKKEDVPDGNREKFKGISNHYPVWAEFRIDRGDDDPINNTNGDADNDVGAINNDSKTIEPDSQSESNETVYVTSTGSKYHRESCRYIRSPKTSTISLVEAKQKYGPCSVCNPPQ